MSSTLYQVLLYYKYVRIEDPVAFASDHLALCKSLGLKGRIIVASEGINGTVSGTSTATQGYMAALRSDERFRDIEFKIDASEGHVFRKIFVRAKEELVTLRYDRTLDPNVRTGKHLAPAEFMQALETQNAIVLDGRTDYEYDLGHFRGAIRPDVRSFRDFPKWIRENMQDMRDKPILTYCTGGIRCEKLTALLLEEGFENVAQLAGGIVTYGKDTTTRGKYFDGKCYVFDERIGVPVNQEETIVVSRCRHCGTPNDRYINCSYLDCHEQHFSCEACEERLLGFCSDTCREKARVTGRTEHSL